VSAGEPSKQTWTVLELLRWTTAHFEALGLETPRLDAECLLAHSLGVPRLRLYLDFDKPLAPEERAGFRELVVRRARERVPVAHLVGQREFWSLPIRVSSAALVPRPDTETLVSVALDALPEGELVRILELGTGTGAVALALASERPRAVLVASDLAQEALNLAQENAEVLGMRERIHFVRGRWAEALRGGAFDCVVSNPPYLAESEREGLAPELAYEPAAALYAGPAGTEALEELCREAPRLLAPGGTVALELAPHQAPEVAKWLEEGGLVTRRHADLAGRTRVVTGRAAGPTPAATGRAAGGSRAS